jgi:hypothetical protein
MVGRRVYNIDDTLASGEHFVRKALWNKDWRLRNAEVKVSGIDVSKLAYKGLIFPWCEFLIVFLSQFRYHRSICGLR